MPKAPSLVVTSALLAMLAVASAPAGAAAYYVGEAGARTLARGGANIVNPGDPWSVWLNPAAVALSHGLQVTIDGSVVWLPARFVRDCGPASNCGPRATHRQYGAFDYSVNDARGAPNDDDRFSPNTPVPGNLGKFQDPSRFDDGHAVENQAGPQPIPRALFTLNLDSFGLDGAAVGGGVWATNAGAYSFPQGETTRYTLVDRDLYEVYYGLAFAYRFQKWVAIGVGVQGVTAGLDQTITLSADLYGNEDPDNDILVHVSAWQHMIPSANFGVWAQPLPGVEVGASVQLGRRVNATGPLEITEQGPGVQELIDRDVVSLSLDNPTAYVSFTLPPFYRAGIKYGRPKIWDDIVVLNWIGFEAELDLVYEQWSAFDHAAVSSTGVALGFGGGDPVPLAPIVQPKDYSDSWSLRTGGSVWLWDQMLMLSGGAFYETAAIPSETMTVELLNGQKVGLGLGVSAKLWGASIDLAYSYLQPFEVTDQGLVLGRVVGDESVVHNVNPASLSGENRTRIAMGRYEFAYHIVALKLNVRFDEMFGFGVVDKAPWEKSVLPWEDS